MPKNIAVLGSTGSVGTQALDVASQMGLCASLISGHRSVTLLEEQIRRFHPALCAVTDPSAARDLAVRVKDTSTRILSGEAGLLSAIAEAPAETVVNSILGEAGLRPSLAVLTAGKRLALANKESMVIAGDIVNATARRYGAEILPVDSEHSAIFQSLAGGKREEVRRILLTASGGPFFGYTAEQLRKVTLKDTLAHPTWKMGKKITVDSATMMNKGFEVIEAMHLFGLRPEQIDVVVHRESIIHSAVEYIDNTVIAEMSMPDMRSCVQYAVTYPDRAPAVTERLDLFRVGSLSFYPPDAASFPCLPLAFRAAAAGGAVPATVNAANEVVVAAFLQEKIPFYRIAELVTEVVDSLSSRAKDAKTLDEIIAFDREARRLAEKMTFEAPTEMI